MTFPPMLVGDRDPPVKIDDRRSGACNCLLKRSPFPSAPQRPLGPEVPLSCRFFTSYGSPLILFAHRVGQVRLLIAVKPRLARG